MKPYLQTLGPPRILCQVVPTQKGSSSFLWISVDRTKFGPFALCLQGGEQQNNLDHGQFASIGSTRWCMQYFCCDHGTIPLQRWGMSSSSSARAHLTCSPTSGPGDCSCLSTVCMADTFYSMTFKAPCVCWFIFIVTRFFKNFKMDALLEGEAKQGCDLQRYICAKTCSDTSCRHGNSVIRIHHGPIVQFFSWTYYKLSNVGREASGPAFLGQIILYTSYCKGTRCIDNLLCCPFLAQIKWISESWMIYLAVYCRDIKRSLHCCIPEMSHCQVLEGWVLYFFAIPLKIYYLIWAPEGPIERQSFDGFVLFDRVNRGEMLLLRFNVLESHGFTLFQPATPCATFFFRCFATPAWWLWHHGQMHVYLFRIQATISWFHARPRGGSLSNWNEVPVHFLPKSLRIADLALLLSYCLQYITKASR